MSTELSPQTRAHIREAAQGIARTLSGPELAAYASAAREAIDGLRKSCKSDADAARIASNLTNVFANLQITPVQSVSQILDNTITMYALAAGSLAGEYELPAEDATSPAGDAWSPSGRYL